MITPQAPAPGIPELGRRFKVLAIFVSVAFLILVARLWQLQIMDGGEKYERSIKNVTRAHIIPAVRGFIEDRKGTVLADNRVANSLYAVPQKYTAKAHDALVRMFHLSPDRSAELWSRVQAQKKKDPLQPVLLLEDLSHDDLAVFVQDDAELPGVVQDNAMHRRYPHATLASHLLGFMNEISTTELATRDKQGYRLGDIVGRSGIERQYEAYLRGESGFEKVVVDAHGKQLTDKKSLELIEGDRFVKPVAGNNVVLTIDADLQRAAEHAMRAWPSGAVAVVEVDTGKILALVSKPAIDPNELSGGLTAAAETRLINDPYRPLIDKSLRENYYPGSTYKVITALAGLEEKVIDGDEKVYCTGGYTLGSSLFRCHGAHGPVNLVDAITVSCNVFFYKLAEKVGMDRLSKYARDFGFGATTGLGLNGEVPGFIPTKEFYEKHGKEGFRIGFTLNTGIGQGSTKVTVLQMALAYAAIANGGRLYLPQLVERIEAANGSLVQDFAPELRRRVEVSPESLALVTRGLMGVVNDPRGTAYKHRMLEVEVAGKTGTAQVKKLSKQSSEKWEAGKDHAWFASFAPADKPKIAVVVLVEHGGQGGLVAAPVAMEIYKYYFQQISPLPQSVAVVGSEPVGAAAGGHDDDETVPDNGDVPPVADDGAETPTSAGTDLLHGP